MDYKVLQSFYINSKGKGLTFNEGDSHSEAEIKEFITPEQLGYVLNAGFLAKEEEQKEETPPVEDTTPETPQQDDKEEKDKKEEITPETEQKEAETKVEEDKAEEEEEDKAEEITDGEVDYSKLSYQELKEMAIEMGYEGKSTKKKDYLNFLKNK